MKNTKQAPLKIEVKTVKHRFNQQELADLGADLARAFAEGASIEKELDQVKQEYKAKLAEVDSRLARLSTCISNKFDMRNERCVVVFHPERREKHYFLEQEWLSFEKELQAGGNPTLAPSLTEPMTQDDFQQELIQAESIFEHRKEIDLFAPAGLDYGRLVVGQLAGKWFSALRVKIGGLTLDERLDSEQPGFKTRFGAVEQGVLRFKEWLEISLNDHAKGFAEGLDNVLKVNQDLVV